MRKLLLLSFVCIALLACLAPQRSGEAAQAIEGLWSKEKANAWYAKQPWLVGCNFIPSTAINQLEMWQADTFDPKTIDRELGWAAGMGLNTMRVFLHDLAWEADPNGFKKRVGEYLTISHRHGIRTLLVLFDDCWNQHPKIGKQPAPRPGVHNSGWVQSPGTASVTNPKTWPRLERYVKDIVTTFGNDERVLFWDLYNEPGNNGLNEKSLPLVEAVFRWARAAKPSQPLSVGVWYGNKKLNDYQLAESDVITFHNYNKADNLRREIARLKKLGRPVICTEYMARTQGSRFETHLSIFKEEKVACYNWGFVSGKTNTIFPWGSKEGTPEPKLWFHDILRADGTPFDAAEVALIKKLTRPAP
ncbi:MAG TPA: cellulase family glycosylhydrolase [Gemmataceae bacterium]|nr:cellulase family glycosylhydrolase [Gemmataceae bacterium]